MVTDIKTIASFIAAAIWVDNEYDETEKTVSVKSLMLLNLMRLNSLRQWMLR